MLSLAAGTVSPHEHHPAEQSKAADDNTARVLGGAALVVGALAICLVLVRRRA
jgi:hypothetical protein